MTTLTVKGNKATLTFDLVEVKDARASSTGKTRLLASETVKGVEYQGQPLRVQVNATIPPAEPVAK
jgi:hypothetical protein